jgi:quinol monooxygenase YgiN
MILVTGSILAKAETLDELLALSLEHVRRSRTEPGCVMHAVHQDAENPLRLVFVEEWTDKAALAAHFVVPGSREFIKTAMELADAPPVINIYEAAALEM